MIQTSANRSSRFAFFLPVRNGSEYIQQAIESVINQTVADWRLHVLDNNSSDDTVEIIRKFNDPRIELHRSDRDLSIWGSWRRIYDLLESGQVTSTYSTILGHDDYYYPAFLDVAERLITAHPDATLYQLPFHLIDSQGTILRPSRPAPQQESAHEYIAARLWAIRDSFGIGFIFKSVDYVRVGGMPDLPLLLFADDLLFARLAKLGYSANGVEYACAYRSHRGSVSGVFNASRLRGMLTAVETYIGYLDDEFSDFSLSPIGKAAVLCLLAREVMILNSNLIRVLIPNEARHTMVRLVQRYESTSNGIDFRSWLGSNVVARSVYPAVKRIAAAAVLSRHYKQI